MRGEREKEREGQGEGEKSAWSVHLKAVSCGF